MKALIIEDEKLARDKIKQLIARYQDDTQIVAELDSIENTVSWLQQNPHPDVMFVDIHLADGLSFDIFDKVEVNIPVIFTTAYNQYAIRAFRVNSIDYLLKPIQYEDLSRSLDKLHDLNFKQDQHDLQALKQLINQASHKYKSRFVTKIGDNIQSVAVEDILYFYTEYKGVYLVTNSQKLLISYPLEEVEELVDPQKYFRLNRKYIASLEAIQKIKTFSNSRLKIDLVNCEDNDVLISREKASQFRSWLDQ